MDISKWITSKKFVVHTMGGRPANDYWIQMANSNIPMMTCNDVIILLDCYRGFKAERHMGNVKKEIEKLVKVGLLEEDRREGEEFTWALTTNGRKLAKHLLNEAKWKMVFKPGSANR